MTELLTGKEFYFRWGAYCLSTSILRRAIYAKTTTTCYMCSIDFNGDKCETLSEPLRYDLFLEPLTQVCAGFLSSALMSKIYIISGIRPP
jgi:hypothetical protein